MELVLRWCGNPVHLFGYWLGAILQCSPEHVIMFSVYFNRPARLLLS